MENITKLDFAALDISVKNYLSWILDAEVHLISKNLGDTIKEENEASEKDRTTALIFLRHRIHNDLKVEYLTVKDPKVLWTNLKDRFDHQRTVVLPKARYEWLHLRQQDFKSVSEYNSELFRICSKLELCGEKIKDEDMLEKTYSTFHASNVLLQQQYRERGFKKYSELISCLLVAEQNNELLMKNHGMRPTGSTALPEANTMKLPEVNNKSRRGPGRRHGHKRGRRRGRGKRQGQGYKKHNENISSKQVKEHECFRCGMKGYWSRTCRTAKHLVELYQKYIKQKGKGRMETNFLGCDDPMDVTHFDVPDFYDGLEGNNEHIIDG